MPILSRNSNLFRYCSYWGTWDRILKPFGAVVVAPSAWMGTLDADLQVEVDLTAVNPTHAYHWNDRVKLINIRSHRTSRDPKDKITWDLPDHVVANMSEWLEPALIERLLHEDFLPQIDWAKYRKVCNGGASFEQIKLDPLPVEQSYYDHLAYDDRHKEN